MWEDILKAIPAVYLPSMLKFILGPIAGVTLGLNPFITAIATIAGMMTIVSVIVYSGQLVRSRLEKFMDKQKWLSGHGRFMRLIDKYGLAGIACFSPLILTPIGGALLALALQAKEEHITKEKILLYMLIAAIFWSAFFTTAFYLFGHAFLPGIFK